jgi:two-component sensor histidine kinase
MNITALSSKIQIAQLATSPDTLSAEADHRIGNNLALIAAMLRLQANDVGRRSSMIPVEEARGLLAETAARIEAVGRLHRQLSGTGTDALVDVGEYLREITASIVASLAAPGMATISFDLRPSCALHANQVLPLGLIVGEVVSNALKYAHPTGLPTSITIGCGRSKGGIVVEIADDGVGLPEGFDARTSGGLGLRLIRSLAEQLGAKVVFSSAPLGMRFTLTVPT